MRILVLLAVVLASACWQEPTIPHPLVSQVRYTCCNLHYQKDELSDMNYLRGPIIPFGTRVSIVEVRKDRVKFETPGHPPLTLVFEHGGDTLTLDQYLERIFLVENPYQRLSTTSATANDPSERDRIRRQIEDGTINPGMTRDQVLMALGYPPADHTPSLDAPVWTYWVARDDTFLVHFDDDHVTRVTRHDNNNRRRGRRRG